jgi:hypothetical protein
MSCSWCFVRDLVIGDLALLVRHRCHAISVCAYISTAHAEKHMWASHAGQDTVHHVFRPRRCRFKAFHERYYHPSNARFWFYGDDDPAERLRLLAAYLDEFEAQPVDSAVTAQPLFQARRGAAPPGTGAARMHGIAVCSLSLVCS